MMRKVVVRVLLAVVMLVAAVGAAFGFYVWRTWDRAYDEVPIPDVRASRDPAVIARGAYLVYGPAHCVQCHASSFEEYLKVADGQPVPLQGGSLFAVPPLGAIYSKNLTPDPETGIGRYSDGQLARMMRYNVRPDGRGSIAPMMPFHNMSEDDVRAVISFLRSQPPVRHEVPRDEWSLAGKIVRSISPTFKPRERIAPPATSPAEQPTRERGEYLARSVSNCLACHTQLDSMTFEAVGPEFAGGWEMEPMPLPGADPAVWFRTPNITPVKGGGLAKFPDRATFIARFKVGGRQHAGSPMPWEAFANMSEADIGALYEFLHSLPPTEGRNAGGVTFLRPAD